MKYFTTEWWDGRCEDDRPIRRYLEYFSSVAGDLPPALVEFERMHTLHDARVNTIDSSFKNGSVALSFLGWDKSFQERIGYVLEFGGVIRFSQSLPRGRTNERELGDLGYWEFELCESSVEMRLLFESGAEFSIEFESFKYRAQASGAEG